MHLSLQIKTDKGWLEAVLPPKASISVEDINPLFDTDAGGAFSYPFTLPVEANQHILSTINNHHGARIYDLLYHKTFRLLVDGYPLLYGIIDLDDEVEVEEEDDGSHSVGISLSSNNQELSQLLDGVNAQDIPLKDRIPVGTEFHSLQGTVIARQEDQSSDDPNLPQMPISIDLPPNVFSLNKYKESLDGTGEWMNSTNVSLPYPDCPYCNVMVAIQKREKQEDGNYKTLREYELFDADRQNSGICFYVQYFLDCVFAHIQVLYDNTRLKAVEDFNRLAFFNTKCECDAMPTAADYKEEGRPKGYPDDQYIKEFSSLFNEVNVYAPRWTSYYEFSTTLYANAYTKYANSKNFPDTEAIDILKGLQDAFGLRFIFDSSKQACKAVFLKDIFMDKTSTKSGAIIHNAYHTDKNLRGVKLTYGVTDEKDTSYNYDPTNDDSSVIIRQNYAAIKNEKGAYDKNTYYDQKTANMYRIKVDEDATTEEELYPSLFEVGQFQDAWVGDITDEDTTQEVSVPFSPVISNIVGYVDTDGDVITSGGRSRTSARRNENGGTLEKITSPLYAVFLDMELSAPETQTIFASPISGGATGRSVSGEPSIAGHFNGYLLKVEYTARYGYSQQYVENSEKYVRAQSRQRLRTGQSKPIPMYEEDPLATYDAGFTLGIMRGPGNDAGVDIIQRDYDGNGNARWAYTPTNYAYTSDSIDHDGNPFDYNGRAEGGVEQEGRFSLKLQAEKVRSFQGEKVDNNTVMVREPKDAAYWMALLFPNSNSNLLALRLVKSTALAAKGWDISALGDYAAIYPVLATNSQGITMMLNAIQPTGAIFTPAELADYAMNTQARGNVFWDTRNVFIKNDAVNKDVQDLKGLADIYYFPSTASPYTLTDVPDSATTDFYPVNADNAHRGLLHKFNYEYFWFLIHSREIVLDLTMELQELMSIDKTKWQTFGDYTGLIKKMAYELDNETGLSHITLTLLYL